MVSKPEIAKSPSAAKDVSDFLDKARALSAVAPPSGAAQGRLIFAMDATASREASWDRAIDIQSEMFNAVGGLGTLDIQLVYFRGFRECKASGWCRDASILRDRMTAVSCRAGRTQIGRVLNHVLKQSDKHRINAVVYVGDCMEEKLDDLADLAGRMGLAGIRAFVFQDGHDARAQKAFQEIARLSGGAYAKLDGDAAKRLRDLLGAVAAFAVGGFTALEDYGAKHASDDIRLLTRQLRGES